MKKTTDQSHTTILKAAHSLLGQIGAHQITIQRVATEAKCAKGLVHYHFQTKDRLLSIVLNEIAEQRKTGWNAAFDQESPNEIIEATWSQMIEEKESGLLRAIASARFVNGQLTGQAVRHVDKIFADEVTGLVVTLFEDLNNPLGDRGPKAGLMLTSLIHGCILGLESGWNEHEIEECYALGWLGLLSYAETV